MHRYDGQKRPLYYCMQLHDSSLPVMEILTTWHSGEWLQTLLIMLNASVRQPEETALLLHAATRWFTVGDGDLDDVTFRWMAADTPDHVQCIGTTHQQRSPGHAETHRHWFLFHTDRGVPQSIQRRCHPWVSRVYVPMHFLPFHRRTTQAEVLSDSVYGAHAEDRVGLSLQSRTSPTSTEADHDGVCSTTADSRFGGSPDSVP